MSCAETRQITVRATCDDDYDDGIRFELLENGVPLPDETITSEKQKGMKKSEYHEFVFTLENGSGANLRFQPAPDDAMWVVKQWWILPVGCPKWKRGHSHIEAVSVSPDGMKLHVHNHNPVKSKYKFALNFLTGTEPPRQISYDPVWNNKNGGSD